MKHKATYVGYALVVSILPVYIVAKVVDSRLDEGDSDMAAGFFILAASVYSPLIVIFTALTLSLIHRRINRAPVGRGFTYIYASIGAVISLGYLLFLAIRG